MRFLRSYASRYAAQRYNRPADSSRKLAGGAMGNATRRIPNRYTRHEESQRALILNAATRLFDSEGIDRVTMTQIAEKSGITRATLYRYFEDKMQIAWAIYNQSIKLFAQEAIPLIGASGKTGFERIEAFLSLIVDHYARNPRSFQFMGRFYSTYQDVTIHHPEAYRRIHGSGFGSGDTARLLVERFGDGSIRAGLDAAETVASIITGASMILSQMSDYREGLMEKYQTSDLRALRIFADMVLAYLKPIDS